MLTAVKMTRNRGREVHFLYKKFPDIHKLLGRCRQLIVREGWERVGEGWERVERGLREGWALAPEVAQIHDAANRQQSDNTQRL